MQTMFRIGVSEEIVSRVVDTQVEGASLSAPHPASSDAEGLNAPFGGAEILIGLKIIAAAFAAGTAAVKFLRELRGKLREGEKAVIEAADGSRRLTLDARTSDEKLEAFVG